MMPIGGNFTMDPVDAAWAARNWIKPPMVTPIQYNSNPRYADPTHPAPPQFSGGSIRELSAL